MSEIKVDTLTGKTSAGDITVTSEGGAATQSLQQGLAKQWANTSADGTTINDSLNVSSLTDNSTGDQTITMTNAMSSATYSVNISNQTQNASYIFLRSTNTPTTTTVFRTGAYYTAYTDCSIGSNSAGDLA